MMLSPSVTTSGGEVLAPHKAEAKAWDSSLLVALVIGSLISLSGALRGDPQGNVDGGKAAECCVALGTR